MFTITSEGCHKTFLVSYPFEGEVWQIKLPARSIEDAQARLRQMAYASVDGELKLEVPMPNPGHPAHLLAKWTRKAGEWLRG